MKTPEVPRPPAWTEHARCLGADTELFYPGRGDSHRVALALCARCPVIAECLGWALEHNEREGVWGGVGARARQQILRAERRASGRAA